MDYPIDLDPTHRVLRVTVGRVLTDELAREVRQTMVRLASRGGPYAVITDLSEVEDDRLTPEVAAELAAAGSPIPDGRLWVLVGKQPVTHRFGRMFELTRNWMGENFELVESVDEAYRMLDVRPEDFTQRLFPESLAA